MQNVARSSIYNEISLQKEGQKPFPLEGRTLKFAYFESLLSPHITANLTYVDTGNSAGGTGVDTQERFGTALRSFEGTGGQSTLKIKISNEMGVLDFSNNLLYVSQPTTLLQSETRQLDHLQLVSEYAFKNYNTTVYEKYYNNISNSVSSILTNKLGVPRNKIFIDKTKNSYNFVGSARHPFDLILSSCANKSVPLQGSAGFLFWETQNGFNFRAIDNLISAEPVATYRYYGVLPTNETNKDNFRILTYPTFKRNEDVMSALRSGVYRTKNTAWNPHTFKYEELYLSLDKSGIKTLGGKPNYNSKFSSATAFTRTFNFIIDSGNMEVGISTAINNNQLEYLAKAAMRYNLFMTQIVDIIVPSNPNLKAGDSIICEFNKVTTSNKNEGVIDEKQSGKYVILNLCHHFEPSRSFTSLRLVRDTYGLYTSGGL